jgi:hypothetical protein
MGKYLLWKPIPQRKKLNGEKGVEVRERKFGNRPSRDRAGKTGLR